MNGPHRVPAGAACENARMRAIVAQHYGASDVLGLADVAAPVPGAGEYLVRVHAAGVNPIDWKLRSGEFGPGMSLAFPWIPGCEVCGTVVDAGPGATRFEAGDEVMALGDPRAGGATAEFAVAHDAATAARPAALSRFEAAGLPVAGLTALQSLVDFGGLERGQHVLINGAAGGVGHLGLQLAKAFGARVTAVCRGVNFEFVRRLGADDVIDRETQDFTRGGGTYDLVFDAVATTRFADCRDVLAPGGTYVTTLPRDPELGSTMAVHRGQQARYMSVQPNVRGLEQLAALVAESRLTVAVERVYPLADAALAHARSETARVRGKLVVQI